MTERGAPLSFCRILAPPNAPRPPNDSKILYYLNDRDEGRHYFCRILAPPPPPPPPPPNALPSPDATILNYLNDSERGAPLSFVGFWRSPPPMQMQQYLTILMTERGGAIISL